MPKPWLTAAQRQAYHQRYWQAHKHKYPQRGWDVLPPGRYLACCGQWHAVTQTPFTAPCCGRTWLEEEA